MLNHTAVHFILMSCALSLISCSNSRTDDQSAETSSQKKLISNDLWFNGGTLHQATISRWRSATEKDKLATCADFVATSDKQAMADLDAYKERSTALMKCIDESSGDDPGYATLKVAALAASCASLLGIAK